MEVISPCSTSRLTTGVGSAKRAVIDEEASATIVIWDCEIGSESEVPVIDVPSLLSFFAHQALPPQKNPLHALQGP